MRIEALWAAPALLAAQTCAPTEVRLRTEVSPDGSCAREVVYVFPAKDENVPPEEQEPSVHDRLVLPSPLDWAVHRFEGRRLAARGFFPDAASIPADFRMRGRKPGREVRNAVSHRRDDFVLFERHRYEERFRPPLDRDAMERALTEGIETLREVTREVLREALGGSYDLSGIEAYLDGEGTRAARALVLLWWEELRRSDPDRLRERVVARLAREGLSLDADDLRGGDALERLRDAALRKIVALLRPRETSGGRTALLPSPEAADAVLPRAFLADLYREAFKRRFGDEEAGEKWIGGLLDELMGDLGGPDNKDFRFDCTVRLPGELLRTNGVIAESSEAFWRFSSGALFPDGKILEAEALVFHPEALAGVEGSKSALSRRDALDLLEALADDDGDPKRRLVEALRKGLRPGTLEDALAPLRQASADTAIEVERILRPRPRDE